MGTAKKALGGLLLLTVLAEGCGRDRVAVVEGGGTVKRWEVAGAVFHMEIVGNQQPPPLLGVLTISNCADEPRQFPIPFMMTLCGGPPKNCFRLYTHGTGKELEMRGVHADFAKTPMVLIGPRSSHSWVLNFFQAFPALARPGWYELEFSYASKEAGPTVWCGEVGPERILFQICR